MDLDNSFNINGKSFKNVSDALLEIAFGHFPVRVVASDGTHVFETFSAAEAFFKGWNGEISSKTHAGKSTD
jgi:hypothetical protein